MENIRFTEKDRDLLLNAWGTSVYKFAEDVFPHLLKDESADFHKEIYNELPKHELLAVHSFRGSAKSTIGLIIYPIWHALFKSVGNISLISMSAEWVWNEISRIIKGEFERNELIRAIFGDLRTSKWSERYFVLSNGISLESQGIGGQLRGGRRGLICLDDLEDEESANSEEQRDKLKRRINKELLPKLLKGGQMLYFGTYVHELCYLKQLMDTRDNGWKKLFFTAYKSQEQRPGNETWVDVFPHERLQRIKNAQGSNYFSCEYMGNPVSDENVPIKAEHIRYWDELPALSKVIILDPAYSEDVKADWKVATLIGIDTLQTRYLVTYIRTHDPLGEYMEAVINLWLQNKRDVTAIGVPNSGVEKGFYASFLKKCNDRKVYPPIMEIKNSFTGASGVSVRNKKKRIIAALQPLFEQGKYYIGRSHDEARDEILTIGQSRWDDIVDTMASAEQLLVPNMDFKIEEVDRYGQPIVDEIPVGDFAYGY